MLKYIEKSGSKLISTDTRIIDPVPSSYVINVSIIIFDDVDSSIIKRDILNNLGTFFIQNTRRSRIPKSDLIKIVEEVNGIDSVSINIVSKNNEISKIANPNAADILDNGIDENCDGVDGYLGIQVISDMNVMVSPNPNAGSFTIEFNQLVTNAEINLTDLNGKVVRLYQLSGDSIQISDSKLEKGVYMLNVSIQGNRLIERIIVQ